MEYVEEIDRTNFIEKIFENLDAFVPQQKKRNRYHSLNIPTHITKKRYQIQIRSKQNDIENKEANFVFFTN